MVGIGFIGAFVPVLPSTCFFISAAYFFSRSSVKMELWVLNHPKFGPAVRSWRQHRAIPMVGKVLACLGMLLSAVIIAVSGTNIWVQVSSYIILILSAIYVVTRPTLRPGLEASRNSI